MLKLAASLKVTQRRQALLYVETESGKVTLSFLSVSLARKNWERSFTTSCLTATRAPSSAGAEGLESGPGVPIQKHEGTIWVIWEFSNIGGALIWTFIVRTPTERIPNWTVYSGGLDKAAWSLICCSLGTTWRFVGLSDRLSLSL